VNLPTTTDHSPLTRQTTSLQEVRPDAPGPSGKSSTDLEAGAHHSFSPRRGSRWHRQGFQLYWKYKSRTAARKPKISAEIVALIQEMARDNRLWGAERIRGELLKLGLRVSKRTIQKYMRPVRPARSGGQNWTTFLHTHAEQIWACDAPPGHRPAFAAALCLFHYRTALTQNDPCGRDAVSQRCMGSAYRCAKPQPMAKDRSTSSVITMASLG
jgi:hypothetical protein